MPPPKRPFTTSSLTSTLKSTIASQPLLSNLTNIDKLSSQASSFAQKSPFFANLTNHQQQNQTVRTNQDGQQQALSGNNQQQQHQSLGGNIGQPSGGANMMRTGLTAGQANQQAGQAVPAASTPSVDMSHLTEEERLMIQSVMAKAEMADMGMPVDTSAPSSTNLPSNASQALVQQQNQLRQQQQQQQQQTRVASQMNPLSQQQNQRQVTATGQMIADQVHNPGFNQQQQANIAPLANNQSDSVGYNQQMMAPNNQQQFNQTQFHQQQQQPQNYQNLQRGNGIEQQQQQVANMGAIQQPMIDTANRGNLPSLEQQTQQLVSQINSQFNLNQPTQSQRPPVSPNQQIALGQQQFSQQSQLSAEQQIPNDQLMAQRMSSQQQVPRLTDSGFVVGPEQSMGQYQPSANLQAQQQVQMAPNQQQSLLIQQKSFAVSGRQQEQQVPLQQQQQQQMNLMTGEPVTLNQLQQMNQQATQMDSFSQQDNLMLAGKSQPFAANQPNLMQQASTSMQYNAVQLPIQASNQQQGQLNQMKIQENPNCYNLNQQQAIEQLQGLEQQGLVGLQYGGAAPVSTVLVQTGKQLPLTHQDSLNQQALIAGDSFGNQRLTPANQVQLYPGTRESPYGQQHHDPRDDIRFRQQVAFESDYYNEQALSDQEYHLRDNRHSSRKHGAKQDARMGLRRYDSADQASANNNPSSHDNQPASGRYALARNKQSARKVPGQQVSDLQSDRSFQAYDLAQNSSQPITSRGKRTPTKLRQLPQPTNQNQPMQPVQSSGEHLQTIEQQAHKNASRSSGKVVRPIARPNSHRTASAHRLDSPYLSASDYEDLDEEEEEEEEDDFVAEDEDTRENNEEDSRGRRNKQVTVQAKSTRNETTSASTNARASSSNSGGKNDAAGTADKTEETARLLSEFKLTEQANQVMEQQQLLIKQGQELIKLQLEQQALSQELKKSLNKSGASESMAVNETNQSSGDLKEREETSSREDATERRAAGKFDEKLREDEVDGERVGRRIGNKSREFAETSAKKSTSIEQNPDSDGTNEGTNTRTFHVGSRSQAELSNNAGDSIRFDRRSQSQKVSNETDEKNLKRKGVGSSNSHPATFTASIRYNRDLLQSPTDTTDSDIEPMMQTNLRRQQQRLMAQTKPKGAIAGRRREPTGLPPSPLPVSAAIQLHQMQQQHFRQAARGGAGTYGSGASATNKANFLRSRSVTSSPNHHLDHISSGYLTDNQRIRSTSPDTLSEFGGQRRRKRLPEPPTNLVPITPSMVRKMIQAQRASGAPTRLPTSVNAQTTLLTNTHSTRSAAFDRAPLSEGNLGLAGPSTASNQAYNLSSLNLREGSHSSQSNNPTSGAQANASNRFSAGHLSPALNHPSQQTNRSSSTTTTTGRADLNKFLSSTYGNSILRNSNISDVKETPELDKLISNLDDYYGLDTGNKRTVRLATNIANSSKAMQQHQLTGSDLYNLDSSLSTSLDLVGGLPISSSYLQASANYPARSAAHLVDDSESPLTRRYSEGEEGSLLASRFGSGRPYARLNHELDYSHRLGGRQGLSGVSVPGSYLNGPTTTSSPYLLGRSSPQRPGSSGIRFSNASTASRPRDNHHQLGYGDQSWRASTSSYNYPRSAQLSQLPYSSASRIPLTSTGSLDLGGSDSLLPDYLANETRSSYSHIPDYLPTSGQRSAFMPSRYSNIDSIRDRYRERYAATGSPSKYAGRGDYTNTSSRGAQTAGMSSEYGGGSTMQRTYPAPSLAHYQHRSFDLDSRRTPYGASSRSMNSGASLEPTRSRASQYSDHLQADLGGTSYLVGGEPLATARTREDPSLGGYNVGPAGDYFGRPESASYTTAAARLDSSAGSGFAPLTKDDIINNGPKFNSIGYRFRTENQNKYVAQTRAPIQSLQTRYPHPYKRILLSKNPKDRIGNGIGVRIIGGQPIPSLYDKVNGCIITSGAFVTEVFQNSNVYFMGEMQEGDQIIEWNGVNLCNRSDQEVQQILLSQLSDDEVEIVFLHLEQFNEAYSEVTKANEFYYMSNCNNANYTDRDYLKSVGGRQLDERGVGYAEQQQFGKLQQQDPFDTFADMNKAGCQRTVLPLMAADGRGRQFANEAPKGSIRRKLSLSSIAHMWSANK